MSPTGLVPGMRLAQDAGLHELAGEWISLPGDKRPNVGVKVAPRLAYMVDGADSIDGMATAE